MPPSREASPTALGRPGKALLPASLRAQWGGEQIPRPILDRAGAPTGLRYDQLTSGIHGRVAKVGILVEHVVALVRSRRKAIANVRVFEHVDPRIRVFSLELSTRTLSALLHEASLIQGDKLRWLTWGQLLSIEGLGVRSALEFVLAVEKAQAGAKTTVDRRRGLAKDRMRVLNRIARSQWARGLRLNDPRLGSLASRDRRSVTQAIDEALEAAIGGRTADAEALLNVVDAMRTIGESIESEHLELQLHNVVAALTNARDERLTGLAARMGILGPRVTLRAAGEMAGVSAARLQQLQSELMNRVERSRNLYLPAVDAAERALKHASPIRLADAAREISDQSISRGKIDVRVLVDEWLPALNRRDLSLVDYAGTKWLICPDRGTAAQQLAAAGYFEAETDREILDAAHWFCRSVGVASLQWVAEDVELGDKESRPGIRRVVRDSRKFAFLDRIWFWEPSVPLGRNRFENTLRKVLAVSPRVEIGDVMEALDRVYRRESLLLLPPRSVVSRFIAAHPSFGYEEGDVVARVPLDADTELGQAEQVFVEVLSSVPGGVLDREALRRACADRGVSAAAFAQYTSFSPILVQPARNLWALRGRAVDERVVQRLTASPRRRRRTTTSTPTADGRLIVSWMIKGPESTVFAIPAAERYGFTGRLYAAFDPQDRSAGEVRVDDEGTSWGYSPFLRAANAASDDRLVATFDRGSGTVTLDLERGAERRWVGDLGNCFLHDESWVLRLYVDDDLLRGAPWEIPPSLADATGLGPGEHDIRWREDPTIRLTIMRDERRCAGFSLEQVLKVLRAGRHDRVFLELHAQWFVVTHRGPANPHGDPLDELLAAAGIGQQRDERRAWSALSRTLGGSSDGGRKDVEERLRERDDQVALGLLLRARQLVAPSPGGWRDSWEFVSELDPDESRFAVRNQDGAIRVAVGVAIESAAMPGEAIIDRRGLIWADETSESLVVRSLSGLDDVVLSAKEPAWVRWARAEHHARRASLSGTDWTLKRLPDGWLADGHFVSDLRDGLQAVPVASVEPILETPNQCAPFPRSAFAFRRMVSIAARDGLVALRSDTSGFIAEFDRTPQRRGVGLADVCIR